MTDVQGRCPACGGTSLFLGDGGYITCARIDCPQPDAATEVIADFWKARQHAAFTFCPQNVGHVTMTEFAKKITEKRTAVAQRAEAVQYANEQKQRAARAEGALARIQAIADEHPAGIDTALIHAALDQTSRADKPATPARPWSTCTVPVDHSPHPWHDPWPLPHGQDAHCPGRPTPEPISTNTTSKGN